MKVSVSWRYGVIGIYKDRDRPLWHLYLPFVRLSIGNWYHYNETVEGE